MRFRVIRFGILFGVALALGLPAIAQEWRGGRARVEGSVKNAQGEPIVGAKVMLRWRKSGGGGPDVTTDKKGKWAIMGLSGGPWNIDYEAAGYMPKQISAELSEANRNPPIDVQLEPAQQAQAQGGQGSEQLQVAGQKISKETAAAVEQGNAALSEKNYAAAREAYLKAYTEMPENGPLIVRIAAAYYGEGNADEGLRYARLATEKDPENVTAWRMIAELELQKGNLEAGKAALDKVPADKINDAQPFFNMGVLLLNKKKASEAEAAFSKAIAVQADLAEAYYYRGLARLQLGRKADAKADLQKNLELAPSGPDANDVKELLKSIS